MKSMQTSDLTPQQKSAIGYGTIVAIIIGILFLRSYFSMFVISVIIAYLFYPLYRRLDKRMSNNAAAALTLLASILSIIIPFSLVVLLAAGQLGGLSRDISTYIGTLDLNELGSQAIVRINNVLRTLPFVDTTVTEASILEAIQRFLTSFSNTLLNYLTGIVGSVLGLFTSLIIYLYVQISVIRHGKHLIGIFRELNPLGTSVSDLYVRKMGAMIRGTVQGQFIIAAVQGFLAACAFALVGYPELFFVLFVIFTALSVIPLGAGIVIIPVGVLMVLFGNVSGGAIVILEHLLINTNVDNILRPMLVPKEARLDSALMLVSVFAGIRYFGFLGIVIGPSLMILIVTTVRVYLDVYKNYREPDEKDTKLQPGKKISKLFS